MRKVIRLAPLAFVVLASLGAFAPNAAADWCQPCSPYGRWCTDLATGQSYFCDDDNNCVPATDPSQLPDVNCKI